MRFGAVIVNFNCARLAIDAALSVLGDDPETNVVIVDNASTDDSLEYFERVVADPDVHKPEAPPASSNAPVFANLAGISRRVVGSGDTYSDAALDKASLSVLCSGKNGGFASGSNLGLSLLQKGAHCDSFLILNPDAVIGKGTLSAFRKKLTDKKIGLCGATVLRFHHCDTVQAFGGAYLNPFTLLGENIGAEGRVSSMPPTRYVERRMSYPLGAALAFRKEFLIEVGPLCEEYFLYYEEADWARRGRAGYKSGWAADALVYHRHGVAAGSRLENSRRTAFADFHMARSRLIFAKKWRPWLVPFIIILGLMQSLRRVARGDTGQARALFIASLKGRNLTNS